MPPNRNNKPLQKWKLFDTNLQYGKSFKKATKKIMDMKYGTGAHWLIHAFRKKKKKIIDGKLFSVSWV